MKKERVISLCLVLVVGFGAVAFWKSMGAYKGFQSSSWPTAVGTVAKTINGHTPASALEYIHEGDIKCAYDLGANAFLVKPFDSKATLDMCKAIKHFWLQHNQPPLGAHELRPVR